MCAFDVHPSNLREFELRSIRDKSGGASRTPKGHAPTNPAGAGRRPLGTPLAWEIQQENQVEAM
jgi:hypothetical protein